MPPERLFFHDPVAGSLSWPDLLETGFSGEIRFLPVLQTRETARIFQTLLQAFYFEQSLILLDADFSPQEVDHFLEGESALSPESVVFLQAATPCPSPEALIEQVLESNKAHLSIFTSGTTGRPKKVSHPLKNLIKAVKRSPKHADDVWGFAYNPTHMAGLQVFFQAAINRNPIINLFGHPPEVVEDRIQRFSITHLSATPTFFRLLLRRGSTFPMVQRVSFGGERFDPELQARLEAVFPNARIRNIYASTEAGTLLIADGEIFSPGPHARDKLKIVNGELHVRREELGLFQFEDEWYPTGDQVEVLSEDPLTFRFLQRLSEEINVGGYKVNPYEVECILRSHPSVLEARVSGKKNPVLGNLLIADVAVEGQPPEEREIRAFLETRLQPHKIPRLIHFVDSIQQTRTGKLQR